MLFEAPAYGGPTRMGTEGWHALTDRRYVYGEWDGGSRELYDTVAGPAQMDSLHESRADLADQYATRLAALKSATGNALRRAEVA